MLLYFILLCFTGVPGISQVITSTILSPLLKKKKKLYWFYCDRKPSRVGTTFFSTKNSFKCICIMYVSSETFLSSALFALYKGKISQVTEKMTRYHSLLRVRHNNCKKTWLSVIFDLVEIFSSVFLF